MQKDAENNIDFQKLKVIGKALKQLRKDNGYSNYHVFSEKVKMTHSQYSAYEAGSTNMTLNTLLRILKTNNISLIDFVNQYLNSEKEL